MDGEITEALNGRLIKELLYKFLIIGDFGVGKTAIIRRYTQGHFSPFYKLTIGVDFAIKKLEWSDKTQVNLQLWDIAGHERFGFMTRVYYKYAVAAVIVFDLSRPATFDSVIKWHSDLREKVSLQNGEPIPVLLLANKCDIPGINIDFNFMTKFCQKYNLLGWFYTSAKDNINISQAIEFLVEKIIYLQVPRQQMSRSDTVQLHCDNQGSKKPKSKCLCK